MAPKSRTGQADPNGSKRIENTMTCDDPCAVALMAFPSPPFPGLQPQHHLQESIVAYRGLRGWLCMSWSRKTRYDKAKQSAKKWQSWGITPVETLSKDSKWSHHGCTSFPYPQSAKLLESFKTNQFTKTSAFSLFSSVWVWCHAPCRGRPDSPDAPEFAAGAAPGAGEPGAAPGAAPANAWENYWSSKICHP